MADQNRIPVEFTFSTKNFNELQAEMEKLYVKAQEIQKAMSSKDPAVTAKQTENAMKKELIVAERLDKRMQKMVNTRRQEKGLVGALKNDVKKLRIEMDAATDPTKTRAFANGIRLAQAQMTKLRNTTQGFGKALGSFQFKFNALGNAAAMVGSQITQSITRAIRDAIKTVIEFEKSFAEVLTLLNKTQKGHFKEVLKQSSVDIMKKYGLTIKDTNKAMFDAISAGVRVSDVYSVLDAAARLAVGGVTDLNSATKGIASVMNAFSLDMKEAENVASAFFQAQKYGITYIDDMVASMGRANTIAKLSGASYREMLAAFTSITKAGLNTEEAVTGLRNIFKELVASSGEAAAELDRLKIATGAIAVQKRGFVGVLKDLHRAYQTNNEIIPKIFGNIRGLTGIMGIVGERFDTFLFVLNEVNDAMASQEALNDAVGEQMNTMSKKLDVLNSTWKALWVTVGDGSTESASSIKTVIGLMTDLLEVLAPDYYENYRLGMEEARKESDAFIKKVKEDATEFSKHLKAGERTQRAYSDVVIKDTQNRLNATKDEASEAQAAYELSVKSLKAVQKELEGTGRDYIQLGLNIGVATIGGQLLAKQLEDMPYYNFETGQFTVSEKAVKALEEETEAAKINYLKKKAYRESLLNFLADEEKVLNDLVDAQEILTEQERKRLISAIKLSRDTAIAKVKIRYNGVQEEIKVENIKLEAEKRLISLSQKTAEEQKLMLERAEVRHQLKMQEIKRKYAKEDIRKQKEIDILIIEEQGRTHENKLKTLKRSYEAELDIIKNTGDAWEDMLSDMLKAWIRYTRDVKRLQDKHNEDMIKLDSDLEVSRLELQKNTLQNRKDILQEQYDAQVKIIENNTTLSVKERAKAIEILTNAHKKLNKELDEEADFGDLIGLSEKEKKYLNEITDSLEDITDAFVDLADARIDAMQREMDMSNERVASLEADRQHEWDRMEAGYANNYALKEKELQDERRRREQLRKEEQKAIVEKKRIVDIQIALNTLLEISHLAAAAAKLFDKEIESKGIIGVATAVAGIAIIAGAFAAFKANAASVAGFAEGGIDIQGKGSEISDSIPARLSRGESVMTAKTTKRNKRTLRDMQSDPTHPLFQEMNKVGANAVWSRLQEDIGDKWIHLHADSKKDDRVLNELKNYHSWSKEQPLGFETGEYRYVRIGNETKKYKKK